MPVAIRIDAFGDDTVQGEVIKVNKYAEPGNFWSSTGKEYITLIQILDPPPALRVGLTAEVQIHVEHREDALQVPVQAIYERLGKTFCLVKGEGNWITKEVVISSTNDKVVAIDTDHSETLNPGEQVVLNPRKHLDKFDQSRFPKPEELVSEETAKKASSQPVAERKETKSAGGGPPQAAGGPGQGGGPSGGGGGRGGNPAQMIERMDQNKDGKLSLDELPAQMKDRLSSADTSGDGFLDTAELTAGIARMRAAGGGGGGPPGGGRPGGGQ